MGHACSEGEGNVSDLLTGDGLGDAEAGGASSSAKLSTPKSKRTRRPSTRTVGPEWLVWYSPAHRGSPDVIEIAEGRGEEDHDVRTKFWKELLNSATCRPRPLVASDPQFRSCYLLFRAIPNPPIYFWFLQYCESSVAFYLSWHWKITGATESWPWSSLTLKTLWLIPCFLWQTREFMIGAI
jgi:hypothetical protein